MTRPSDALEPPDPQGVQDLLDRVRAGEDGAAEELFPGGSAIGRRISLTHSLTSEEMATVIGVVGDVRYGPLEGEQLPAVYLSERQAAMGYGTLLVRTTGEPSAALEAVRAEVRAVDPNLPLYSISTLADDAPKDQFSLSRFYPALKNCVKPCRTSVIDVREAEVGEWQVAQPRQRVVGRRVAAAHGLEQTFEVVFTHVHRLQLSRSRGMRDRT